MEPHVQVTFRSNKTGSLCYSPSFYTKKNHLIFVANYFYLCVFCKSFHDFQYIVKDVLIRQKKPTMIFMLYCIYIVSMHSYFAGLDPRPARPWDRVCSLFNCNLYVLFILMKVLSEP